MFPFLIWQMKFTLVFLCACVVITHQQFQTPRAMLWFSPYYSSPQSAVNNYQAYRYNDVPYLSDGFNRDKMENQGDLGDVRYQSRIRGSLAQEQVNPRFFFGLNPFAGSGSASAVPTIMSLVTTVASIVTCVPANQFDAAKPPPTACVGRRRRQIDDVEYIRFAIAPTATLKLTPTHLVRENRQLSTDQSVHDILSTKDDITHDEGSNADETNMRDRRFFLSNGILSNGLFGGSSVMGAASVVTSYAFVATTLRTTVNLIVPAPPGPCPVADCADCLPAGYIVCPP